MKRSITHSLAALALGFAAPLWAQEVIICPGPGPSCIAPQSVTPAVGGTFNDSLAPTNSNMGKSASVSGNSVSLRDNTGGTYSSVFGAVNRIDNDPVTGNKVFIEGSAGAPVSLSERVYGGSANGDAAANSVLLSHAAIGGNVVGGESQTGNATGNSVSISNSSVSADVQGGVSLFGNATGNTVSIGGASSFSATSRIYGGVGLGVVVDFFSNNTLKLEEYRGTASVQLVQNFQSYAFVLSAASQPLVAATVRFGPFNGIPGGAQSSVSAISLASGYTPALGTKIPLICVDGGGLGFVGNISNDGGTVSGSGYTFRLSQEDDTHFSPSNCVYATVTDVPPPSAVLSSISISNQTSTGADFSVTSTNTAATGYWQVIPQANACDSANDIATAAFAAGDWGDMYTGVVFTRTLSGLNPSTAYRLCFVADNFLAFSAVEEATFSTLGAGPGASATGIPALNPAMLMLLTMVLAGAALRRGR